MDLPSGGFFYRRQCVILNEVIIPAFIARAEQREPHGSHRRSTSNPTSHP